MTPATVTERRTQQTTDKTAIRPFRFEAPEADSIELRRRINATRFPEKETVTDFFRRACTERSYHNLIHFNGLAKGGHFAAWEQPQLFSEEVRTGFRSLRG